MLAVMTDMNDMQGLGKGWGKVLRYCSHQSRASGGTDPGFSVLLFRWESMVG